MGRAPVAKHYRLFIPIKETIPDGAQRKVISPIHMVLIGI